MCCADSLYSKTFAGKPAPTVHVLTHGNIMGVRAKKKADEHSPIRLAT
jgi:hypothetical protein